MGLKAYATVRGGAKFVVLLFSAETGALLAVIEADKLGQMRTGAAPGVATKYLARPDADRVGCYGTGWQARSQLEAVCAVRRVREVRVYGRDAERRARFAEEMAADPRRARGGGRPAGGGRPRRVDPGDDHRVEDARPGGTLDRARRARQRRRLERAPAGRARRRGRTPGRPRRDRLAGAGADRVRRPGGRARAGGDPLGGRARAGRGRGRPPPGRTRAEQITLFESQGVAMEDVAVAVRLVARARERGVGTEIPI